MTIDNFINLAVKQDKRNSFGTLSVEEGFEDKFLKLSNEVVIPNSMKEFYMYHNPEDVEIDTEDLGIIRFYSYDNLKELQEDYSLNECFVFATIDGDPIFTKEENVYIGIHGTGDKNLFEKLASSFLEFINIVCDNMI